MEQRTAPVGRDRMYRGMDWLFLAFLALEVVAFAVFPGLPLAVAAAAAFSQLRTSKGRISALWILAGLLTLMAVAPFVLHVLGWSSWSTVEPGPLISPGS